MTDSKNIVVTGAASGIGRSIAQEFLNLGHKIWGLDLNAPESQEVEYIYANLTNRAGMREVVDQLPSRIDVVVNAAGVSGLLPIPTVMNVNFYGLRALTRELAPRINLGGAVVNIASTSGWFWRDHLDDLLPIIRAESDAEIQDVVAERVQDGYSAYARSKEAVVVWSAMAAQEYLGKFRVNSVSPGPVQTPLLDEFYEAMGHEELDPLTARAGGRNGFPEEIADVVLFLASDAARWINGTDVPVDNSAEISEFLAGKNFISKLVSK
jgi:NAD(P)-dependent dehydrogenase (short-subunit alcohol dehydrogenase family)